MTEFAIPVPDEAARRAAQQRLDGLVKPLGALGRLEELGAWLCAAHGTVPPRQIEDVRVVVFAGDHGVTLAGDSGSSAVSAYPRAVTGAMVRAFVAGSSGVNVLAGQVGATVRVADIAVDDDLDGVPPEVSAHKIRRGSGAIDREDALLPGEARRAFDAGRAIAEAEIEAGADLLIPGDMGIGNTTVAAALVAASLGVPARELTGTGTGIDEASLEAKAAVIDTAVSRAACRVEDPFELFTALGSGCAAATAGFVVGAAQRAVPVVLDGVFSCAAALVARDIAPEAARWWLAGHRSTEPAQTYALKALGLEPILDLGLRLGEGSGAVQAVSTLRAARAVLAEMGSLADLGLG
ncbi:nicotinate-nucleotide--dimethylbenzimidazole phosphoribosyltransferase [Haloechinothrix sp. LS1_15]|uniref:nicotinate-nucleotide--dimethylbenzimidazole phosphoribosyltransferase n=1 Tax=Haloechinothrix sp. LS1_15 TaxID=2652248 RepID=UPI0029479D88|nr:nicotinate-nucleotide--dimethylbenzimidazole phosphoribosyltransferase [Haloechinothrix sp. LS1_15]MDV6013717.1 nicotinate-nucleotide--dimethylbenzimidazole phosphoribosyltransferase [Haloechinothrix sp. LS1_15]